MTPPTRGASVIKKPLAPSPASARPAGPISQVGLARRLSPPKSKAAPTKSASGELPASASAPASVPAELKLEAIHYRLKKPSVVINGATLYAGGEIGGARIVSIGRESVQITTGGQTRVLNLP